MPAGVFVMRTRALLFCAGLLLLSYLAVGWKETGTPRSPITPVEGPSWLKHLGLRVSQTQLGQMGGDHSIPATPRHEPRDLKSFFTLAGADLYRMNCRACHGPQGTGAPPEINSLIGPVQAMSPALIRQRMKARGVDLAPSMVRSMAAQAETSIRQRLLKGGEKMPAFAYLRDDEVNALLAYLEKLANVPESPRPEPLVQESAGRVGQNVVKGTCHICHNATGPGGGHMAMMRGIIPSLASFPQEQSLADVIRQVHYGSGMMMRMMGGDRMPALPYLTDEEIAAAYFYLQKYPPPEAAQSRRQRHRRDHALLTFITAGFFGNASGRPTLK